MANVKRLLQIRDWVIEQDKLRQQGEPSEWDQGEWLMRDRDVSCGTVCCIAGKVVLEDGGRPEQRGSNVPWDDVEDGEYAVLSRMPNGALISAREYAQQALGLGEIDADDLFSGGNDLTDVLHIIDRLVANESGGR